MPFKPIPNVPPLPYAGRGQNISQLAGFDQDLSRALHSYLMQMANLVNANGKAIDTGLVTIPSTTPVVDGNFVSFDGTTGLAIKDSGKNAASFATAAQGTTADSALQPGDNGYAGQVVSTETNTNNYTTAGNYITPVSGMTNLPDDDIQARHMMSVTGGSSYVVQVLTNLATNSTWQRSGATVNIGSARWDPLTTIGGSNSDGTWTKFADGTMICSKTLTGQGPIDIAWGNLFQSNSITGGNYAKAFIAVPEVSISSYNTGGGINSFLAGNTAPTATAFGNYALARATTSSAVNYAISLTAKGRWRT